MTLEERKRTKVLVEQAKKQTMQLAHNGSQTSKKLGVQISGTTMGSTHREVEDPTTKLITHLFKYIYI